jgi:hypothetical protein
VIRIAPGVDLPAELVTEVTGILARRSAGKTYTAKKIAEQVIKARLPVVIIDPLGAFWGLRSSADGMHAGLRVVIFGGAHGDIALTPDIGKTIAEAVVENPGAYIVDLSHFDTKGEEVTFMTAFLERLYRYKAKFPSALLLIIDEADTFAPQKPQTTEIKMLGSMESIVRRGRLRGLGVILISQRAAVINKNVLTQIELLILHQTTSPQDRKAVLEWISAKSAEDKQKEVMASIGSLARGEAWIWSPAWLDILVRAQIDRAETFDSSKTPEPGEAIVPPAAWLTLDVNALGAKIVALAERQQQDDPGVLRRQIAELERKARIMAETLLAEKPEPVTVREPVAIIAAGDMEKLEAAVAYVRAAAREIAEVGESIGVQLEEWAPGRTGPNTATFGRSMETAPTPSTAIVHQWPEEPVTPAEEEAFVGSGVGKADRAFLAALAQFPAGISFNRAAFLAGYSPSVSTTRNALSRLRTRGFVTGMGRGDDLLRPTPAGLAALGPFEPAPTGGALVDYWAGKLGKAQQAFFTAIVREHPRAITQDEAATLAGYDPRVSTTRNTLSSLRSLGLIVGGSASLSLAPELTEGVA